MSNSSVRIQLAEESHKNGFWKIFQPVIQAGDTYDDPKDTSKEDAIAAWFSPHVKTYVALGQDSAVMGFYKIRTNSPGNGSHVANCSYVVNPLYKCGVGTEMGKHSIQIAQQLGYRGIQFNRVVSTNEKAINLWKSLGFEIIGITPGGFWHSKRGEYVDVLIMYRSLLESKL